MKKVEATFAIVIRRVSTEVVDTATTDDIYKALKEKLKKRLISGGFDAECINSSCSEFEPSGDGSTATFHIKENYTYDLFPDMYGVSLVNKIY